MNTTSYKILIAEDEQQVGECLAKLLQARLKVEVVHVIDGAAAVELTRQINPDLILLDIEMPKLRGWDVIREVRKFNSDVKIVITTAQTEINCDEEKLICEQVEAVLRKPTVLDKLEQTVKDVMAGNQVERFDSRIVLSREHRGSDEARSIVHALANTHSRIRMKCECLISDYEEGLLKGKSQDEIIKESIGLLKEIVSAMDEAGPIVEKIRRL